MQHLTRVLLIVVLFLGIVSSPAFVQTVQNDELLTAIERAADRLATMQTPDGGWPKYLGGDNECDSRFSKACPYTRGLNGIALR